MPALPAVPRSSARRRSRRSSPAPARATRQLKAEAADLLYHLLVLLESRGVAIADVLAVLDKRSGVSGLKEKAERPKR